jgi:hypothetical protein
MNELYFWNHHLLLDQQPDIGRAARLTEHAKRRGGEYPREVAAGNDDNARGADVGRSLYDQGPIFGELPAGTVLHVRHRNGPCLSIEISIGAPLERTVLQ